jgi:membrane dipeptidase
LATAQTTVFGMVSLLFRIERESQGRVRVCSSVSDIHRCMEEGALAPVVHIEGAEAIDPKFEALEVLHAAGLRSLGPVGAGRTPLATVCRFGVHLRRTRDQV